MEAACSRELNRFPSERPQLLAANRTMSSLKRPAQRNRRPNHRREAPPQVDDGTLLASHAHDALPLARDAVLDVYVLLSSEWKAPWQLSRAPEERYSRPGREATGDGSWCFLTNDLGSQHVSAKDGGGCGRLPREAEEGLGARLI